MLLSDKGLDEETPESDAHDLTEADRTSFGAISSGDGDVDEIIALLTIVVVVAREGHDIDVGGETRSFEAAVG